MELDLELKIKFADVDDLKNFLWIMGLAKEREGTVSPLACGLISSILKRLELPE